MDNDAYWLKDWALFCAIKEDQDGKPWYEWPEPLKNRNPEALAKFENLLEPYIVQQQTFMAEWTTLRKYANGNGVKIIGDVPIFIAHDSADVWSHRELFQLDEEGYPTYIAGVPVLARVAAIFRAMCPDLPIPTTTVLPEHAKITLHAFSNSSPIRSIKACIAFFSSSIVRIALFIKELFKFMAQSFF